MFGKLNKRFLTYFNKNLGSSQRYTAFTLAEVLITLGIIGVVAALTIPALISKTQDSEYKTAYKKAFSEASQAMLAGKDDFINIADDTVSTQTNFQVFMAQFNTVKKCTSDNASECWNFNGEKFGLDYSSGYPTSWNFCFIDKSGCTWCGISPGEGRIAIDTNGFKKPNQYGKDRFAFTMTSSSGNYYGGGACIPFRIIPWADNPGNICVSPNKCATEHNYYGTSWLYK